jgi:hypothetical protein
MQTTDELTNIRTIFQLDNQPPELPANKQPPATNPNEKAPAVQKPTPRVIESEIEALKELRAIPLFFASSHALVKPYVTGFDTNLLDLPSLKHVRIDTDWKLKER